MLKLHFLNVADGDAILIEVFAGKRPWRMLVDTGKADLISVPGSRCCTSVEHLHALGIDHLDALVITHLHVDHFGYLPGVLDAVSIDAVYAGFFPRDPHVRIPPEANAVKAVQGLIGTLNHWNRNVERMRMLGIRLVDVHQNMNLSPTAGLSIKIIAPAEPYRSLQRRVWQRMLDGKPVDPEEEFRASKSRNRGSLRVQIRYAGRRIELAGDCYAEVWDQEPLLPCDILKVPHHCDAKSMTPTLAAALRPAHAIISWSARYDERRDRPSARAAGYLLAQGTKLWCTDCFASAWHEPQYRSDTCFTIFPDGALQLPDEREPT